MKKKELVNEVSQVLKQEKNASFERIDELGTQLSRKISQLNINYLVFYVVFLLLFIVMYHRIANISFVSDTFYLKLLIGLIIFSSIIAGGFFTLYIYNRKKRFISLKHLKLIYLFYKIDDILSFIGKFLTAFLWLLIFVITPVEVSGSSMENTFKDQDKLLVWQFMGEAEQNDVIIIDTSENYLRLNHVEFIIKRVAAVSGDILTYENKNICVNGEIVFKDASYEQFANCLKVFSKTETKDYLDDENPNRGEVPPGYIVVFGDNRINSYDSKSIGLISKDDIVGKCIMRIAPLDKFGFIK